MRLYSVYGSPIIIYVTFYLIPNVHSSLLAKVKLDRLCAQGVVVGAIALGCGAITAPESALATSGRNEVRNTHNKQSPRWELARQKRTAAVKLMEEKGVIKVDTDDIGNQFLSLPWLPDQKILYKSLSISQRLKNEVFAGAMGELVKDCLLHPVDTSKTRRQSKRSTDEEEVPEESVNPIEKVKELYSGFPVVLMASIPQGSGFFLVKKGMIELISNSFPTIPKFVPATVPIAFAAGAYWFFRTPAEVVKTLVQTKTSPDWREAYHECTGSTFKGFQSLYKHYDVMLWLDIPFQIIVFILYGIINDTLAKNGFEPSLFTRLFTGMTCGIVAAAVTCPIDTCKTRMLRGKSATATATPATASISTTASGSDNNDLVMTSVGSVAAISTSSSGVQLSENVEENSLTSTFSSSNSNIAAVYAEESESGSTIQISSTRATTREETNSNTSGEIGSRSEGQIDDLITQIKEMNEESIEGLSTDLETKTDENLFQVMTKIYTEEGFLTLFSGLIPRLVYTGLANGIRLTVYGTARMDLMLRTLESV